MNPVLASAPTAATTLPSYGGQLVQMLGVLGVLVALLYLALRLAPTLLGRLPGAVHRDARPRRMTIVERLPLGPRRALLLVRLNDREVLFSSTEQGVKKVEELS